MPQSQIYANELTYQVVAESAATYAHKGFFSSRRGLLPCDGHILVAYDNNPYADDPDRRGRELRVLKAKMQRLGCELVGEASYPKDGESIGYTVAIVWRGPNLPDDEEVSRLWHAVLASHF